METRRPSRSLIESTPTTGPEEAQRHSTQELQGRTPETPKPRGFEGRRHTPETKAKMSEARKGKNHPNYGKKLSPETKAKMSEAKKGKNHPNYGKKLSPETKAKMSAAQKGKKHPNYGKKLSPETKAKMSAARKGNKNPSYGKKLSSEHRTKLLEANIGRKHTPETRDKMSEARKGEKNHRYDQSIDKVRSAIIDCVLGESQSQASRNQGFSDSWLKNWKRDHRQRFDALYLEAVTELGRMVTNGKIGSLALELAPGPTRQDLARKLAKHLLISSESPP